MNRLILYFLIIVLAAIAYAAYSQQQPAILLCAAGLFPLFMVFRNKVNDDKKQQELLDAVRKQK